MSKKNKPLFPTLSLEVLRQRKATISSETILDLEKSKLIFVNPDEKNPDYNNYFQSRSFYGNDKEINELKESIILNGILEPLLVCKDKSPDSYRVLEGNRRAYVLTKILQESPSAKTPFGWSLSSLSVKITENPEEIIEREHQKWLALNKDKDFSDEIKKECKLYLTDQVYNVYNNEALHRNTQRKQWTWVEQMRSCKYRMDHKEPIESVAASQNMTKQTLLYNLAKYNELKNHPQVMEALNAQQITKSVATLFLNTNPRNKQALHLLKKAKDNKWSAKKVDEELTIHKLKKDTRKRIAQPQSKKGVISFSNYQELTDFFLKTLLSLSSENLTSFLEQILDHEKDTFIPEEFKTEFFKYMSEAIIAQKQENE